MSTDSLGRVSATFVRCDATDAHLEGRCGDTSDDVASEGSAIAHPDVGVLKRGLVRTHSTGRRVPASVTWLGEGARACANPLMRVSKSGGAAVCWLRAALSPQHALNRRLAWKHIGRLNVFRLQMMKACRHMPWCRDVPESRQHAIAMGDLARCPLALLHKVVSLVLLV